MSANTKVSMAAEQVQVREVTPRALVVLHVADEQMDEQLPPGDDCQHAPGEVVGHQPEVTLNPPAENQVP